MLREVLSDAQPRVALVTGCLGLGGATTFLCNLAGELAHRQIAVKVLCLERLDAMV